MAVRADFAPELHDERDLVFTPSNPAAARTLTAEEVDHYNTSGFLSPLPLFDDDETDRIRAYVDDLLARVVGAPDRRNAYSINSYHLVCRGLYDLILTPRLLDYVEDIVGPDIVSWGQHLFCKLPGDPMAVPLHQDAIYWPLAPARSVTAWLAIDDADEENAAMQLVPGSHRLGAVPHVEKPLDGTRVLKRQVAEPTRFPERFNDSLRAGEISLHSDLLLHGSPANPSDRRRAGLTIRFAAASVRPLPGWEWFAIPTVHCRGSIPPHWPQWPRPPGEDPEKLADVWGDFDGTPMPDAG